MTTTTKTGAGWQIDPKGVKTEVGQYETLKRALYKPTTARRRKPVDLFANATARRVESETWEFTYGRLSNSPRPGYATEAPGSYWARPAPDPAFKEPDEQAFAYLDNRVRAKIKDQNVNLANALAEYRQTSNLLLSTARDVIRTFHSLRSGRPIRDFVSMLAHPETRNARRLANRWLEYQYGWRPLLSDVHGGAEALAKELRTGVYLFQTAFDRREAKSITPHVLGNIRSGMSLRMKVRARYMISAKGLKTLSEIGFLNPLAVAWEIIPWSFVIDWIIPVGDYLNGLDALTGVSDLKVIRSYKYQVDVFQELNYSGGGQAFGPYPTCSSKKVVTNRFAVSGSLSFGTLRYEPSLTATRLANAIALLRQLKS